MEQSPGALDAAIVRVRDQAGRVVGAGFLVGDRELLTCAHVVGMALGHPNGETASRSRVSVDFPLVAPDKRCAAEVAVWHPGQPDGAGDVAGLRLVTDPPAGARPARLVIAPDVWDHPFRAFGFPHGQDGGVWASGRLLGRQSAGWVQLDDDRTAGFAVGPGFSGTPVWDSQLDGVVGMAVAAEATPSARTAYLIPSGAVIEL
ncbi:MAG: S1 family peptidase, partial [Egibacteraceae bacterium]